jgi:hypothetical protein
MKNPHAFVTLLFICFFVQAAFANKPDTPARFEHSSAMASVRSVDIDRAVYEIGDISSLADGEITLSRLSDIETRSDWSLPAREAVIYQFTQSLVDLPRDAVAEEVMQHLRNYQPRALVPHEDHGDALVPLFNIRAAAAGIENGWQRKEYAVEASGLLEADPESLVAIYNKSANHNQRSAILETLQYANLANVVMVQNTALALLDQAPALTPLIGVTAVITADTFAVQQLLVNGRGAGLSSALVQVGKRLQYSETANLLVFAVQQAPAVNATLAISAWWPGLRHDADTRDLMTALLADPELGASAALALAQSPDMQTIKVLLDTAAIDSVAGRRARMALDINRDRLVGEHQP